MIPVSHKEVFVTVFWIDLTGVELQLTIIFIVD